MSVFSASRPGPAASAAGPSVVISPPRRWESFDFRQAWAYRHILYSFFWRNVKKRYRQTALGPLWWLIGPLVRMGLFSLLLGNIAGLPSEGVAYPIFALTGLLPWELLAKTIQGGTRSLVSHIHIISKVFFPRIILPLAESLYSLLSFLITLPLLLILAWSSGIESWSRLLLLPFLIWLAASTGLAFALLAASIQVRYRDTQQFIGYLVQFWFYATPAVYSANLAREHLSPTAWVFYTLNPMYSVCEGFRWALFDGGHAPGWPALASAGLVLLFLLVGAAFFQKMEHSVVDIL